MPGNSPTGRVSPLAAAPLAEAGRLAQAGRFAEAIAPLVQAARLEPGNAGILHNLGLACLEAGRPRDAVAALRRAIELAPRLPEAHLRLGAALEQLGETDGAIAAYGAATDLAPSLTEARFRLALLLDDRGRRREAAEHYRRVRASANHPRLRRLSEVRALIAENRDAEARAALRKAIEAEPGDAYLLDLMGGLLSDAGDFEAAGDCYERALAAAPQMVGCYYDLVRCRRYEVGDPILGRMLQARGLGGLADVARMKLNLAIGKVYDDIGDYPAAMAAFDAAYAVRAQAARFSLDGFERLVDRIIARFTPDLVAKAQAFGRPERTPVLIVGMPRSGTTLVEQIVSSHRDVAGGGELQFWPQRGAAKETAEPDWPTAAFVGAAADDYLGELGELGAGAVRVTDKMPSNFLSLGLVHMAFPNAAILHCRRRPIDTALSMHQTAFMPSAAFPTGGPELVGYYRGYLRIMDHWRAVLPADRLLEVDYDALTHDPEPVIRRMIDFVGLDWDEACLHPEWNERAVKTPSKWQVKQPITPSPADRWRRYEAHLGPLADLLQL